MPDTQTIWKTQPSSGLKDPSTSKLFKPWKDPISGVTSFILDARVAPLQQSFYFTNPSYTDDHSAYWFYGAFPPSGSHNRGRCLGLIDFAKDQLRFFPETQFLDASPAIDTKTGEAYWASEREIWKRGPGENDRPVFVNRFPASISPARHLWRLATHFTFSADRRSLNIDAEVGREWFIGEAPLDGSPMKIWQKFSRCYNHGQFSPTDPDLQLIAQDYANDPILGAAYSKDGDFAAKSEPGVELGIDKRMWLLRKGEAPRTIFPGGGSGKQGHEWWSRDGKRVWYMHYGKGVEYIDVQNIDKPGEPVRVWPFETGSHAHVDAAETMVVADFLPNLKSEDRHVKFLTRQTGKIVSIVSNLPSLPETLMRYHIDPHPQFCKDDTFVAYTTTVLGRVDVAFVRVADLREATK